MANRPTSKTESKEVTNLKQQLKEATSLLMKKNMKIGGLKDIIEDLEFKLCDAICGKECEKHKDSCEEMHSKIEEFLK